MTLCPISCNKDMREEIKVGFWLPLIRVLLRMCKMRSTAFVNEIAVLLILHR